MVKRKPFLAANWKMNGLRACLSEIEALREGLPDPLLADVIVCPPATLLHDATAIAHGSPIGIGAQDCHWAVSGAFTGDISAAMLKDAGACTAILGHSERRSLHGETSRIVRAKAGAALGAGLIAIVCVGETAGERAAGLEMQVCARQLAESLPDGAAPENTIVAYEPVWAIGNGVTPAPAEISAIHSHLRELLARRSPGAPDEQGWRILYGGSVTPANADAIFGIAEVDGVLVGGASLKASSFLEIVAAALRESRDPRL